MTAIDPSDSGTPGATGSPAAAHSPEPVLEPAATRRRARRPYRSWVRRLLNRLSPGQARGPQPRRDGFAARLAEAVPFVVALALAAAAQNYFDTKRDYFWDGVTLYAAACVSFLIGVVVSQARAAGQGRGWSPDLEALRAWVRRHALRVTVGGLGIALVVVAGLRANETPAPQNCYPLLYAWALGCTGFIGAFLPGDTLARLRGGWDYLRARVRPGAPGRWIALALLAVMLLAAAVRMVNLDTIPINLSGDEGTQGVAAREFLPSGGQPPVNTNMFVTGWYSVPNMSFFYDAFGLLLFGDTSIAGLRFPWALLGWLAVLCTFLLVRELWHDNRLALLAAFLLAVNHYHLHFSRLGSNQVADTFFMSLTLWLFVRGERQGGLYNFALAGAALGASLYGYFGARVVGIVLGVYVLYKLVFTRGYWQKYRLALVVTGLAAVLVAFPLLRHFQLNPELLSLRFNQVGIVPSGWLEREVVITGKSEAELWGEQWRKSLSAFNYWHDPTAWYLPGRPLLDSLTGIAFVLGAALAVWRARQPRYLLIAAWFLLSVFIGWVLTENPPSSMRVVVVAPSVAILAALAAWEAAGALRRVWPAALAYAAPAFLIAVAVLNLDFYFREYTPTAVYGNPDAEVATLLGRDLQRQADPNLYVYFFGAPNMYFDFGSIPYMAPDVEGTSLEPLTGPQELFDPKTPRRTLFVFLEGRTQDEQYIVETYAGGCSYEVHRNDGERIAYYAYLWPCQ